MEILLGNHQVVIDGNAPMPDTVAAALKLWQDTTGHTEPAETVGFTLPATISEPVDAPLMAPEIPLPYQLVPPPQEDVDDRGR